MIINYLPFLSLSTEILLGHPYRLKRKRFFFFSSSNKRLCITKWHTKKKEHIDCNKTSLAKEIYQWYHSLIYEIYESSHACMHTSCTLYISTTGHFPYLVAHTSCFFFSIVKYCTNLLADFSLFFFVSWYLGNPTSCPLFSHLPWSAYPLYSQIPAPYICLNPQIRHHVQNVALTHSYH